MPVTGGSEPGAVFARPRTTAAGTIDPPPEPAFVIAIGNAPSVEFRNGLGDVVPGPSPFAHLAEDSGTNQITADWQFLAETGLRSLSDFFVGEEATGVNWIVSTAYLELWADKAVDVEPTLHVNTNDGSLHWGDGTAALDTYLQRTGAGLPGYLSLDPGGGFALGDITEAGPVIWFDGNGVRAVHQAGGESLQVVQALIVGDAHERFQINTDGSVHWGSGAAVADTILKRGTPGTLRLDQTGTGAGAMVLLDSSGTGDIYLQGNNGTDYVELTAQSSVGLDLGMNGAGIHLLSPDGTKSKTLRLSDAGALELV